MKYVVLKTANEELPIIFPNTLVHAEVAMVIHALLPPPCKVVSAGDYSPMNGMCSGKSTSLNIGSRYTEDATLIKFSDYGAGIGG